MIAFHSLRTLLTLCILWFAHGGPSSPSSRRRPLLGTKLLDGLRNGLASGLAAGCVKTCLQPFDTVKTVQQHHRAATGGTSALGLVDAARQVLARGADGTGGRRILGGAGNLYAGLGVTVVGSMPSVGLYFGVYSYCKQRIGPAAARRFGDSTAVAVLSQAVSAIIGNTVASCSRVPYEVVKQKLQTGLYPSTLVAIRSMAASSGIRAFFPTGGIAAQMARDIPYAVFTLVSYEYLRRTWVRPAEIRSGHVSPWRNMVTGGLAGGIGSFLTNPMDVVKTRLQTDPEMYKNVLNCFRMTYEGGGAAAFLRGATPRLMHKIPANAVFFPLVRVLQEGAELRRGPGRENFGSLV
mmetsp:Transcript_31271/g.61943  ORF Transcript_31271/g.61943 Transcript_31271/m.61943 type:complete len:351 (+) Transcript_31271:115-1167(+)